ncbi:MAG TPA: PHP domain-containing protein, partial [Cyclobacteriaceae bacterium]
MYLIFDTETTGIPHNKTAPLSDLENWPRLVQLAWQLHDQYGKLLSQESHIIKPDGFDIPFKAEQIHGISTKRAQEEGIALQDVFQLFIKDLNRTKLLVGHNIEFDINIIGAEYFRQNLQPDFFLGLERLDTGIVSTEFCQLAGGIGGKLKMPRLNELHLKLFNRDIADSHDAAYDVDATARSFFGLIKERVIKPFDDTPVTEIEYEEPSLDTGNSAKREKIKDQGYSDKVDEDDLTEHPFSHLHVHSQFSVLQATPSVKAIVAKAKEDKLSAVALTDLGNMYG